MNKKIIIAGIFGLALISGGLYIATQNSQTAQIAQETPATMQKNTSTDSGQGKMMEKTADSRYIPYLKDVYDSNSNKRRVLYFYATWCPSCKAANEDFTKNPDKIPEDVIVIRTNYNDPDTDQEEKDLAKKYGITYQHTFVQIDSTGKEVTKWNGGQTSELLTNIK